MDLLPLVQAVVVVEACRRDFSVILLCLSARTRHRKPPLRGGRASGRRGQGRGGRRPRPRLKKGHF